jgi:hypothetical protein
MRQERLFASALLLSALLVGPSLARADRSGGVVSSEHLGKVDFPTSCAREAQPSLEKGLALLHSFQYTESEKTFADASTRDPKCAIAHWGKAMARYHQIWDFPDDKTLERRP